MQNTTPYTDNKNRLADVIAAIQVMGTYKFYKLDFSGWADRISGDINQAEYWKNIFEQHPEFFRLDQSRTKASLVWRRNYQKLYNVDTEHKISRAEFKLLDDSAKERISRSPLTHEDISTLVKTAINLHSSEIEHKRDSRWWQPWIPVFGTLLGIVLGRFL
ncbi:N-carbamoyl-L-amino acid amidohydrolase [Celerinatantimonas sp. MCCC 1A17872]|uniref:N-carbamoyl-L-amino acid amidohydrolase n=1 Tax=Celerinatantimonas sp. MCCC 1A17872 TaxID=3177514 RepID=UPI0038CA8FF9